MLYKTGLSGSSLPHEVSVRVHVQHNEHCSTYHIRMGSCKDGSCIFLGKHFWGLSFLFKFIHSLFQNATINKFYVVSAFLQDVPENRHDIERFVWSSHKLWLPRPLLSMHVRMGDKACEMKVVGFDDYMHLADKIRRRFPHLNRVWLSTEMQVVSSSSVFNLGWVGRNVLLLITVESFSSGCDW